MGEVMGPTDATSLKRTASKLLTFLIADVRGYTHFTAEHGDEAAARLASRFAELCEEIVGTHDGQVIELRGDEAVAIFPSARSAVRAAVALQEQFGETIGEDLAVAVGIGLDAGDAVPVRAGYRTGALNLAARLQSLAWNQVFASETVVALARKTEGVVFVDRGQVTLKGLDAPVRVLQIGSEGRLPDALPPLQPILVTHPTNLPDSPTSFVGREQEIAQLTSLLQQPGIRLVTLTGPGGSGKTRLALQVGASLLYAFSDGVFFCDLSPLTDQSLVPSAIAAVLGVKEGAGKDLVDMLIDELREKHLLLVLDNFEQVLNACQVVARLLDECHALHILVTSRIPLHLRREHQHPVPPLRLPDPTNLPELKSLSQFESVRLFIERARAVRPDFAVTNQNAPAVAEICTRLDGLPLAIELAGARIKLFPPQALLQRLGSRLTFLTGGARDRPGRQQTLRATIDWSYSLLSAEEQVLLAQLSVFAGGCSFDAAETVCNSEGELNLLEQMTSLVDKSLLGQDGEEEPRFHMLETIREYATEKLTERGEADQIRERYARYFLVLAEEARNRFDGPEEQVWLARLDADQANLRGGLQWFLENGAIEAELRMAGALYTFWSTRGYWSEGRVWLEAGLEAGGKVGPPVLARALLSLGLLEGQRDDYKQATSLLQESLGLYRELGDAKGTATALNLLGGTATSMGQYASAHTLIGESVEIFQAEGEQARTAQALAHLGMLERWQGHRTLARERFQEALALFRAEERRSGIAVVLQCLGELAVDDGNLPEAEVLLQEGLDISRELGRKLENVHPLTALGSVAQKRGQYDRARELFREALLLTRDMPGSELEVRVLWGLIPLAIAEGEVERAALLKGAVIAILEKSGEVLPPIVETEGREVLDTLRATLGDEALERALAEGGAMSLEQVIACALGEVV